MIRPFFDRRHAGEVLARKLHKYADQPNTLVLALPRGGVPVGYEIARSLHTPLAICPVCKIGVPGHKELAMGALAPGGVRILNQDVIDALRITSDQVDQAESEGLSTLAMLKSHYQPDLSTATLADQTIIVADDGMATGVSMKAAVAALAKVGVGKMIVVVPVCASAIGRQIESIVDEFISAAMPENLHSVSSWYEDFTPTTTDQARRLLNSAAENWLLQDAVSARN